MLLIRRIEITQLSFALITLKSEPSDEQGEVADGNQGRKRLR